MRKHWRTKAPDAPAAGRRTGGAFGVPQAAGYAAFLTALAVFFVSTAGVPGELSVRGHVDAAYTRSPADDIGRDAVAYTSPLTPARVAGAITDRWQPGRAPAADGRVRLLARAPRPATARAAGVVPRPRVVRGAGTRAPPPPS
ncbi:hypothetical protein Adi01nite_06520 [Amorphoplanes digitatis]|nr:hypothetical protein Adi01nite_06520 [Actinoplanes digitatis]